MKKMSLLLLMFLLLTAVNLAGEILFFDDFDRADGVVGNGWNDVGTGVNYTIQSGAMRIESSNGMGVYRDFTSITSGEVIIRFHWKIEANNWLAYAYPNDISCYLFHDNQLDISYDLDSNHNNPVHVGSLPLDTWMLVRMEINLNNDTFTLLLDDTTVAENVAGNNIAAFYKWSFKAYPSATVIQHIDDFLVADGFGTSNGASAVFGIDNVNPQITLTAPNGGEVWQVNQTRDITWIPAADTNLLPEIDIQLSIDGGGFYFDFQTGVANTGISQWTIPALNGDNFTFKVIAEDSYGNIGYDESDAPFSISTCTSVGYSSILSLDTVNPVIDLTTPDGGEIWQTEGVHDVIWTASDTNLSPGCIAIEFSSDDGANYVPSETGIDNTGTHGWTAPDVLTEQARLKLIITDDFGNLTDDSSIDTFTLDYQPPESPDNVTVDISNGTDAVISWDAVTQSIFGQPLTPDGYILFYSETSNCPASVYTFLATTADTTCIDSDAVLLYSRRYYMVMAYKDMGSRWENLLAELEQPNPAELGANTLPDNRQSHTWSDLKSMYRQRAKTDVAKRRVK
ncbi:MAG: hypothetical protein K8S56_00490 [Candidatus Cloacimonetes bacterium]|nr:hypothetical protein [Candidatus Cloacimonadota bacterium]